MVRKENFLLVAVLVGVLASIGYAQNEIVAMGTYGELGPLAVSRNGDWFTGGFSGGILSWGLRGNVFTSAGVVSPGPIVGVDSEYWLGALPMALDAAGNIYVLSTSNSAWSHQGLLGEITGHQPNGNFAGIAVGEYGIRLVAVTDNGDAYMHTDGGSWVYSGNLFTSAGVVSSEKRSLGSVKQLFR
jgi:hypothetical protein